MRLFRSVILNFNLLVFLQGSTVSLGTFNIRWAKFNTNTVQTCSAESSMRFTLHFPYSKIAPCFLLTWKWKCETLWIWIVFFYYYYFTTGNKRQIAFMHVLNSETSFISWRSSYHNNIKFKKVPNWLGNYFDFDFCSFLQTF